MPSTYTKIELTEMDSFLRELGFVPEDFDSISEEYTYVHTYNDGRKLVVYTSISKKTDAARKKGSDAIRLLVFKPSLNPDFSYVEPKPRGSFGYVLVGGASKTLRQVGWRMTFARKIYNTLVKYKLYNRDCVVCGDHDVVATTYDGKTVCGYHLYVGPTKAFYAMNVSLERLAA